MRTSRVDADTLPPSSCNRTVEDGARVPGLILVFTAGEPAARPIALGDAPLEIGRGSSTGVQALQIDDERMSRRHVRVVLEAGRCVATDLGSMNGTFIDGERATPHMPRPIERALRIGDTLFVPCDDLRALDQRGVRTVDGFVRGPAMQQLLDEVVRASRATGAPAALHVRGESGTGKEGVAHAFHRAGPRAERPLIAVNCATIPHALAERLLFGARRGAYSGADADVTGYVQEADGGTLFLDEIAELDAAVQAKLLRVLEAREVLPLGASRPRKVDFALCSATAKDLRAMVSAGTWREDLYFRIARPSVAIPSLRERPEEISVLIAQELARRGRTIAVHASLVEQCVLRAWPGNVRELLSELRVAVHVAMSEDPPSGKLTSKHLAELAGNAFGGGGSRAYAIVGPMTPPRDDARAQRGRIEDALRASGGNVAAAARALGWHRTQLRRLIDRFEIVVANFDDGSN